MKKCCVCKQFKEPVMFNRNKARYDGLHTMCKLCDNKKPPPKIRKEYITGKLPPWMYK